MKRFPWESLLALGVGLSLGLYYAWVVAPHSSSDITPATLRDDFKDQFRVAIASAYVATGNLDRARARLSLLGDPNPVSELAAQAQRALASGDRVQVARDLAYLASDLTAGTTSFASPTSSAAPNPSPSPLPNPTHPLPTPHPSPTAIRTLGAQSAPSATLYVTPLPPPTLTPVSTSKAPFQLLSQDQVCNPNLTAGLLQIVVVDKAGQPMPGVEIGITWATGEEHFFTGFKPEISPGYADFVMQADTRYALLIARSGSPTSGISAPTCQQSGSHAYFGGLKLTFRQP